SSCLGIGFRRRLQGSQLRFPGITCREDVLQPLVEVLAIVLRHGTALVLVEIVVDLVEQGGKVFEKIVDFSSASIGLGRIVASLADGLDSRVRKLDQKLEALVRLLGDFAELVGLRLRERIATAGARDGANQ